MSVSSATVSWDIETHLVDHDEEGAVSKNGPDEDVAKDAGNERVRMRYHDGAIPVNGDEGPGEGTRDNWRVNEAGVGVVAEVE